VDPGVIAAIIGAISAVVVAVLTAYFSLRSYPQQKRVDRENYAAEKETDRKIELRNQRMKDYERFITDYHQLASLYDYDPLPTGSSEAIIKAESELWVSYSNLFQTASDPVLRAASDFYKFSLKADRTNEEHFRQFSALYAKMIMAMRDDVSEKTEMKLEEMQRRVPFEFAAKQRTESEPTKGEPTE
jgi:hypothetical protein